MPGPRLKTNLAILVLGDAAGKVLSFVAFSRLARILEPEANGHLEFAYSAIVVGALVIEAGLGPWGARAVARDPGAAGPILGRVMALRGLILALVVVALGAVAAVLAGSGGGPRATLLAIGALMLVPKPLLCEWVFQGRSEMATVTATMVLDPLIALLGTLAFVHEPAHLARVPVVLAAATAAVAIAQQAVARARGVRPALRGGLRESGSTLRASIPLGLSTLLWALRFHAPMLALGLFSPGREAGAFGASHRLVVSVHAVVWLYFFNLLPVWSRLAAEGSGALEAAVRRSLGVTVALAAALVLGVSAVAGVMTVPQLYGPAYGLSVDVLRVAVLVPGLAWVSGNFRFGMIARGALRGELVASACGAATSLVAFALLRSGVGAWSATAVFCASETVTLLAAAWLWRRTGPRQPAGRPTKGA